MGVIAYAFNSNVYRYFIVGVIVFLNVILNVILNGMYV